MGVAEQRDLFRRGVDLFNAGDFYDCHEVLEELWMDSQAPDRLFLQSLIHFAVGFYHHECANRNGATRQLRKGLKKIQDYLPDWDGVCTELIEGEVRGRLARIEGGETVADYPRIVQSAPWPGLRSPLRS